MLEGPAFQVGYVSRSSMIRDRYFSGQVIKIFMRAYMGSIVTTHAYIHANPKCYTQIPTTGVISSS